MPLAYEIENLDAVDPAHREYYARTEAGGFRLDVHGIKTAAQELEELRTHTAARRAATAETQRLEKLAAARAEIERLEKPAPIAEPTPGHSDDARLEAETAAKLAEHVAGREAQIAGLRRDRDDAALARVAVDLAAKLAVPGSHELLLPHIRARLVASDAGGALSVTAKDAPTLDALAEEFRSNPAFARIVTAASAADQARHQQRVNETLGVPAARPTLTRAKFDTLRPAERAAHVRAGAEIFDTQEIAK